MIGMINKSIDELKDLPKIDEKSLYKIFGLDESKVLIMSITYDFTTNTVTVSYKDISEQMKQIQEIITKAIKIKKEIETETNEVKKAILISELAQLANQYNMILSEIGKEMPPLYDVI